MDFHTDTVLANGLRELLQQLEKSSELRVPVNVFLAGGMAVHLYTASRTTSDVDAEFASAEPGRRVGIHIPRDLAVEIVENGVEKVVFFDTNYNSTFALMHEDYMDDALPVEMGLEKLRLFLLSPVDLAVSKIARWAEIDREDITALVSHGLTTADAIEKRAVEALGGYVGNERMLRLNIRDAVQLARDAEAQMQKKLEAQLASLQAQGLYRPSLSNARDAYKQALAPGAAPGWAPEQERRAASLEPIKGMATGALLTFAEIGAEAIQAAGSAAKVDWLAVEERAIFKGLSEDRQPADDVYRAVAGASPAAVTQAQQSALRERIDALASTLDADRAARPPDGPALE